MLRQVIGFGTYTTSFASVVVIVATVTAQQNASIAPRCEPTGSLIKVADLPEASGVAVSRRIPGRIWAHNDSGEPALVALDSEGTVVGRIRISGLKVEDWEAVAVGPCPAGTCIYVGDIGDNEANRHSISIYRVPEPGESSGSAAVADVFRMTYPDRAQDAEALLVTPKGEILIVTKGDTGPVALYRVPQDAKPGGTVTLQPIGKPRHSGKVADDERITDGAISPSGEWVALRTKTVILLYRTQDLLSGNWREASRISIKAVGEPQGEGITFADDRAIYLVGEGGAKSQPGTFGRLTCMFDARG
jgi:hypothetical protein